MYSRVCVEHDGKLNSFYVVFFYHLNSLNLFVLRNYPILASQIIHKNYYVNINCTKLYPRFTILNSLMPNIAQQYSQYHMSGSPMTEILLKGL